MIDSIGIYRYRLPLTHTITWNNTNNSTRDGLLICITCDNHQGWGEISPLPGFSLESLNDAIEQAITYSNFYLNEQFSPLNLTLTNVWPSVQFGFELGEYNQNILHHSPKHPIFIESCMLMTPELLEKNSNQLNEPIRNGYKAVKIKVGAKLLNQDINLVHRVCEANPDIELRIDANRSWSLSESLDFVGEMRSVPISFIEEPLKDIHGLGEFTQRSPIPLALDETLRESEAEKFIEYAQVYILKPSLYGGISDSLKIIDDALFTGKRCIISSSYETGIGMNGLLELACNLPDEIHGLDTYRIFKEDIFKSPSPLIGPNIELHRNSIKKNDLNFDVIEKVWERSKL